MINLPVASRIAISSARSVGDRYDDAVARGYEIEYFFGLHCFSKGVVAAEISEHDDGLPAIAFEDFLVALRDPSVGARIGEGHCQLGDACRSVAAFAA